MRIYAMINYSIYTIVIFLYSLGLFHFYRIAFTLPYPKRKSIVYIVLGIYAFFATYTLTDSYYDIPSKTVKDIIAIFYFSARVWIYLLIFRCINLRMALLSVLTIFIDSLFSAFLSLITRIPTISLNIVPVLLETLLLFLCIKIIKKKRLEESLAKYIRKIRVFIYILAIITIALISLLGAMATFSYAQKTTITTIQICSLLLLIIISVVVSNIVKIAISEQEKTELSELLAEQIENQVNYYERINEIYDEFRSFRHDFQNHIFCLQSILDANDVEQAQQYLTDLVKLSAGTKPRYNTGSVIIDALLNDKSQTAENQNTFIDFTGYIPTTGIHNIDLCTIFSNAIVNAIEACDKSNSTDEKHIQIHSDFRQGYYFLTITNPIFEGLRMENGRIITSKKNKTIHGYGLANIIKTVKKYNGKTDIYVLDNAFHLELTLLLNKNII